MIDHVSLITPDYARAKAFYSACLAPLGARLILELAPGVDGYMEQIRWAGFGRGEPSLWVGAGQPGFWGPGHLAASTPVHVAFTASTRAAVDAFHRAALAAGARDYGAPGVRQHYHPHYYGAFVLDPDGNNVEAVCHVAQ